jgi:hypothetical protein
MYLSAISLIASNTDALAAMVKTGWSGFVLRTCATVAIERLRLASRGSPMLASLTGDDASCRRMRLVVVLAVGGNVALGVSTNQAASSLSVRLCARGLHRH